MELAQLEVLKAEQSNVKSSMVPKHPKPPAVCYMSLKVFSFCLSGRRGRHSANSKSVHCSDLHLSCISLVIWGSKVGTMSRPKSWWNLNLLKANLLTCLQGHMF